MHGFRPLTGQYVSNFLEMNIIIKEGNAERFPSPYGAICFKLGNMLVGRDRVCVSVPLRGNMFQIAVAQKRRLMRPFYGVCGADKKTLCRVTKFRGKRIETAVLMRTALIFVRHVSFPPFFSSTEPEGKVPLLLYRGPLKAVPNPAIEIVVQILQFPNLPPIVKTEQIAARLDKFLG